MRLKTLMDLRTRRDRARPEESMQPEILIDLRNISVIRGNETILDDIRLSVARNEIVTLIGPNGAGKSCLVKIALGLMQPDRGSIITSPDVRVGYVPQSVNIDRSVPVNVTRFLQLSGIREKRRLDEALELVGGEQLKKKPLQDISGGELRRVLLARAILKSPDLLILDEPTAGVDISGQTSLYALIQTVRDQTRCGVLLVSHNLHIVLAATDKVFCLNRHICCSGTPEDVQKHPEVVSLFGQENAATLGVYRHLHDHEHNLHGDICPPAQVDQTTENIKP